MTPRELFALRARQQKVKQYLHQEIERARNPPKRPRERKPGPARETVPVPEGWISVREFAKLQGICETGVFKAIQAGRVQSVKSGHCRYVNPKSYEEHRRLSVENHAAAARRAYRARSRHCAERRQQRGENS